MSAEKPQSRRLTDNSSPYSDEGEKEKGQEPGSTVEAESREILSARFEHLNPRRLKRDKERENCMKNFLAARKAKKEKGIIYLN